MEIVRITEKSIRRKLGYKNQSKKPLLQEQVDDVVGQFLSQPTIQGLANAFRVALAYEATLRWDDYEDMTFGDFIVTNDFWSVGHLCSFDSLEFCLSIVSYAFSKLSSELSLEQIAQWSVMFRGETRFADCKRVKNEISGIPEEPQRSLPSLGVRRGYAWNAFSSERIRYRPIPKWHP
jgi:hypothetical protein